MGQLKTFEDLDHLITAYDEGLIDEVLYKKGRIIVKNALKILNGYIHYLQKKAKPN